MGVREGGRGEDVGAGGDLAFDSGVVDGDWEEGGREEGREGGRDVREYYLQLTILFLRAVGSHEERKTKEGRREGGREIGKEGRT